MLDSEIMDLSTDMVGFWRTETIAAAVRLNLFDHVPGTLLDIAAHTKLPKMHLERLLRALWELDLVFLEDQTWQLSSRGKLLSPKSENFLMAASVMWSDINSSIWKRLPERIKTGFDTYHAVFKALAADERLQVYHRAIDGYTALDASVFVNAIDWKEHHTVIGVERNSKVFLEKLLESQLHLQGMLLGDQYIMKHINLTKTLVSRYVLKAHDLLEPWGESADAIIFPKVLHFWPDAEALQILKYARHALLPGGKIYLFEMLLSKESPAGSLLDLNILVETGGKLRFLSDWKELFSAAKLTLRESKIVCSDINLLVLEA
ncbi:MAG: methyltransferase [Myxococcaceae bacterium]